MRGARARERPATHVRPVVPRSNMHNNDLVNSCQDDSIPAAATTLELLLEHHVCCRVLLACLSCLPPRRREKVRVHTWKDPTRLYMTYVCSASSLACLALFLDQRMPPCACCTETRSSPLFGHAMMVAPSSTRLLSCLYRAESQAFQHRPRH